MRRESIVVPSRAPAQASCAWCLLLAGAIACSGASREPRSPSDTAGTRPRSLDSVRVDTTSDSLRLQLEVPGEVALGAPVRISLRVENASAKPVMLYLRGRAPIFDVHVLDARGDTVWHRLEGEMIQGILAVRELAPGEALVLGDTWPQRTNRGAPVPPGRYIVHAILLTDTPDGIAFPPATLRIGGR
jgi:hypothetical protein